MQAAIAERVEQFLAALATEEASGTTNGSSGVDVQQELRELILDGRGIRAISQEDAGLLQKFSNLSKLTLNQTGLASLVNIPCMPSVHTLEATDNHITSGLDMLVKAFSNLKKLQLGGNHIKTFEELEPLAHLNQLEQLGLDLNPVASLPEYRERIFQLLPSLLVLDSRDRSGVEREAGDSDSDEEEDEMEEMDTTLKDFYEGEIPEQDDEDAEDFEPPCVDEEDEEIDEEDDGIGEDEDDAQEGSNAMEDGKRKADPDMSEAASKLHRQS